MNALAIVGLVVSILASLLGATNWFLFGPEAARLMESGASTPKWISARDFVVNTGYLCMFAGLAGMILGAIPALKAKKIISIIGWIAAGLGAFALFSGLATATHMF